MKLFSLAALLAAFALPIAVSAQQYPPQGAPVYGQANGQQGAGRGYNRWMRVLSSLNLSQQQQQQVQGALGQYYQSHPAGSPRDPQGMRALRDQIFGILSPQQQNQLRSEMQQMKVQRLQQQLQRAQQQGVNGQPPR